MDFELQQFDPAEKCILDNAKKIAYLVLEEVLDADNATRLAHVNFDADDLRPYLDEPVEPEPTDAGEDEVTTELGALSGLANPSLPQLADAAVLWVRESVGGCMYGRSFAKFKLRIYRPKGEYLRSFRFGCLNHARTPQDDEDRGGSSPHGGNMVPAVVQPQFPAVQAPEGHPGLGQPQTILIAGPDSLPEARVWATLGDGFSRLLNMMQASYGHLATLQNNALTAQAHQIGNAHKVIETISKDVLQDRQRSAVQEQERQVDDAQVRLREALGKQFLSELGAFGRVLMSSKLGVAPEISELADLIGSTPELNEAIRDPEVRAMLKDEATRRELASLLLAAAKANKKPGADASTHGS